MIQKIKYKFRSSININYLILGYFIFYLVFGILLVYCSPDVLIYLVLIISGYLFASNTLTYLKIDEDRVEIISPLKLTKRIKNVQFHEITLVQDINYSHRFEYPRIKLELNNKKRIESPANSFPVYSYKMRQSILQFFASKNIPVEIKSDKVDEMNILN